MQTRKRALADFFALSFFSQITVGGASKTQFIPEAVSARPGDVIRFMFMDAENSVVQTTFEAPCAPKAGGFVAGPLPNPQAANPGPTMDLTISAVEPLCARHPPQPNPTQLNTLPHHHT
jgi:hypothetical protein